MKLMKEVVTGKDIGKSKYEEVFEKELDGLCVEYGMKKHVILKRHEEILIKMKEKNNTSYWDDEYLKIIQGSLNDLEGYLKAKTSTETNL